MNGETIRRHALAALAAAVVALTPTGVALAAPADDAAAAREADRTEVAALDTEYQAFVKANDADGMSTILHDEFVLVTGIGKTFDKQALLQSARNQDAIYTHQEEIAGTQTVRVYGSSTAVVTAQLWIAYVPRGGGEPQDYKLWFSDTYVRTSTGWRYAFGQAAQRLPAGS